MRIHNIGSRVMGPGKKVVVTLDLQLYDMAMKLWIERADVRDKFLFRPGELHVALWALTALGKYWKVVELTRRGLKQNFIRRQLLLKS